MASDLLFSLIVPTRGRPDQLQGFLTSVSETADHPEAVEVVLVIDADDPESLEIGCDRLILNRVVVPPGLSMGALNMTGYEASAGRYLMLLNDDVVARSRGWDTRLWTCFRSTPDEVLLVHVNDTVFQQALCTFPVVSRTFCELAGGICPREYVRYRIDDHIEDVFNLLGVLGERRSIYLPDVVFEHTNFVEKVPGLRQYFSDEAILAVDAPRFEALLPQRKELAVRLKTYIENQATLAREPLWRSRLETITDCFALRVPGRLRIMSDSGLFSLPCAPANTQRPYRLSWLLSWAARKRIKIRECVRQVGYRGLARIVCHKLRTRIAKLWPRDQQVNAPLPTVPARRPI